MQRRIYAREIYFYVVCLVALIIFIIGLVNLYESAINYAKPTTYQSRASMVPMYKEQYPDLSQQEIDKLVEEEISASLKMEKDMAFKGIFRGVLLVVISIPIFLFHWKKAQDLWNIKDEG